MQLTKQMKRAARNGAVPVTVKLKHFNPCLPKGIMLAAFHVAPSKGVIHSGVAHLRRES